MKVPDEDVSDQTYESPTLSPTEVRKVLNAWAKQDRPLYIRNQSVISLTFATGLRISEIAKIQWKHININEGSLRVVSGKGKKSRSVVIVDQGTDAIADLIKWRDVSDGYSRIYVYCPVYKGDNLGPDRPIGRSTISHIVENTSKLAGVELTHHSGRKTLLTELSRNDVPVSDLLAQSGHARADTLMEHYVKPADVDARRKRVRTRWKR